MLDKEELQKIKDKMKKEEVYSATFARRLGISRQAVNLVLNQKCASKRIETYLREWLNGDK